MECSGPKLVGLVLTMALWLVGPAVVWAQPAPDEVERFTALVSEASSAQEEGDHPLAIELYREAARINDHPRLQVQIAQSYEALGDCERAGIVLQALLARRELSDDLRERAMARREGLQPCDPNGRLVVQCVPSSLAVSLRLEQEGFRRKTDECPVRWSLPQGDYEVVAETSDHPTERRSVTLTPGETQEVLFSFGRGRDRAEPGEPAPAWVLYGSLGALVVGGGLVGAAVASDRQAPQRAATLRDVRDSCESDPTQCPLVEQWEEYNDNIRRRNTALYASGGILVVSGGAGLVWALLRNRNARTDQSGLSLMAGPGEIGVEVRW